MPEIRVPFFPNQAFAWTFCGVLLLLLVVAVSIDLRRKIVPKWLSLTTLALGVTCNLVRGAWLGSRDVETWWLGGHGPWLGAADGFLFALAGFLTGFGAFFFMWIMGACGGGDVKIFAAVSAWVGPYICLWIMVLATVILIVLLGLQLAATFLIHSPNALTSRSADKKGKALPARGMADTGAPRSLFRCWSLPLALATALALFWFFRVDLDLAHPWPQAAQALL
jgi:Flp pilus assembly protein protease CpaA